MRKQKNVLMTYLGILFGSIFGVDEFNNFMHKILRRFSRLSSFISVFLCPEEQNTN